jgi:flagellar biosynthesis GTPase FlhF
MIRAPVADSPRALDPEAGREVHVLSGEQPDMWSHGGAADPRPASTGGTRTYRGRTVEELIPQIQNELGADAIILRRREGLTGGLAGFFQRPFIELEAMPGAPRVDLYDEPDPAPVHPPDPERFSTLGPPPTSTPFYSREPLSPPSQDTYLAEHLAALTRASPPPAETPLDPLDFTSALPELTAQTPPESFSTALDEAQSLSDTSPAAGGSQPSPRGRIQADIQRKLCALGIGEQFAEQLIDAAAIHILPLAPRIGMTQAVAFALAQRMPVSPPLPTRGAAIVLVGPGGAGKTSCTAALLAAYRKSALLPASCATLTLEQEKGELQMLLSPHIMKPTAIDAPRVIKALHKTRSEGMLVVDTPPLSPRDRSGIRKLTAFLGELQPERVVIVLPATLGAVAAAQLLKALRPLDANALAITHADETDQIGVAVEAACSFGLAPEYLLNRGRRGRFRLTRVDPNDMTARLLQ